MNDERSRKTGYITIANWNVGGAKYLKLISREENKRAPGVDEPLDGEAREDFRDRLNEVLRSVLDDRPEIVTLQEIVRYADDGNEDSAEHVLKLDDGNTSFACGAVKYKYYPCWLINNHDHWHQGKWDNSIVAGGWISEKPGRPFFAQGNAILVRDDINLYPIWDVPRVKTEPPDDPLTTGAHHANEADGHRFIEQIQLHPGLYFGDRDTEPRAASVAHFVLSYLPCGTAVPHKLEFPLDIFVINLHLTTLTMERDGVPDTDKAGEQTRLRQLEIVLNQIVSPYNRWRHEGFPIRGKHRIPNARQSHTRYNPIWVIAGDLNFTPESMEYHTMLRRGFMDLIDPAHKFAPKNRGHTKAAGAGNVPTHTLDYVFAGPLFQSIDPVFAEANTGNNHVLNNTAKYGVSDHYPLRYQVPILLQESTRCKRCEER